MRRGEEAFPPTVSQRSLAGERRKYVEQWKRLPSEMTEKGVPVANAKTLYYDSPVPKNKAKQIKSVTKAASAVLEKP